MSILTDLLTEQLKEAFAAAGYDASYGAVRVSDRPDLCEFQCNGAMAGAKQYRKAPLAIAGEVAEQCGRLKDAAFTAEAVRPGFLNLNVKPECLPPLLAGMAADEKLGIKAEGAGIKAVIDYGGPNVAKPLHVGHLRAAVIGESIKRICREAGCEVLGDVHLGDWGLQMGLIITELKERQPELPYFDENASEFPSDPPFTISELEEIYPAASARSKEDEAYRERALEATSELQAGRPGYIALWKHILSVSVADLKRNYERLDVHFDLWKAESDVQPYIPGIVERMKSTGIARLDDGALVVDVTRPEDKKEIPPCIVLKSDGASLYSTTDIATIYERMKLFSPDRIIYVVDKRQAMHFEQVFRTVRKAGIAGEETELIHVGFGTMNGKDGKPFKTREGGVMRLETLIKEIRESVAERISENPDISPEEAERTVRIVAIAALKYGDLSNQAAKDYVFDMERFASFEGNTGPYILYTAVRIKSILRRYLARGGKAVDASDLKAPEQESEKALCLELSRFPEAVAGAWKDLAPHRICQYVYGVAEAFNSFYHEVRILQEEDERKQRGYLALIGLTGRALEVAMGMLGMEIPEQM